MWFRFLSISVLHWTFSYVVFALLSIYVFVGLRGILLAFPIWIINFLLSFGFATWAFQKRLPGKRDGVMFLTIWFVTTFSLQVAVEMMQYGYVYFLIQDYYLHVQYVIDVIAILSAVYITRRKKIAAVLGEGMME
ncbi:hypothetical protein IT408_02290 [Candidatus Uhrbacteria bacterium]|nr:hypothetical protein [Candidatus Uhrbacteria bacterium]